MIFNVFVFNLAQRVVTLPADCCTGMTNLLRCPAVDKQAINDVARSKQILSISRLVLPQNKRTSTVITDAPENTESVAE